jgi:hypothetical protein
VAAADRRTLLLSMSTDRTEEVTRMETQTHTKAGGHNLP